MNREIRDVRDKLRKQSITLRNLANETSGEKGFEIRDKQNQVYNKWKFYTNILKANDKIK